MSAKKHLLIAKCIERSTLSENQLKSMFNIFNKYYSGVTFENFLKDIKNKSHVFLMTDRNSKKIEGFSTIVATTIDFQGSKIRVLFSGDTVVNEQYWGQKALVKAFFWFMLSEKLKNPFKNVYWFLVSKGYKTYLLMTNNYNSYWPRYDKLIPDYYSNLIKELGVKFFDDAFSSDQGIVKADKFVNAKDHLKPNVSPINKNLLDNPNINYFQNANPKWQQGDELACVAIIDFFLITSYPIKFLYKFIKKTFQKGRK